MTNPRTKACFCLNNTSARRKDLGGGGVMWGKESRMSKLRNGISIWREWHWWLEPIWLLFACQYKVLHMQQTLMHQSLHPNTVLCEFCRFFSQDFSLISLKKKKKNLTHIQSDCCQELNSKFYSHQPSWQAKYWRWILSITLLQKFSL